MGIIRPSLIESLKKKGKKKKKEKSALISNQKLI